MKNNIFAVYAVQWEESERGWGTRPDGASFHCSIAEAQAFIKHYWDREKANNSTGEVPDEYSRPVSGKPELIRVKRDFYEQVMNNKSVRLWQNQVKDVVIR
ncbi:MAG TPA: hypothetical protein VFM18_19865 [Methanosarcina sp.]|nr:hypothetical protein [Methanosarcina sp.]